MAFHHRFSKRISKRTVLISIGLVLVLFAISLKIAQFGSPAIVPCAFRVEGDCVILERVENTKDLQFGLSGRDRLAPTRGMLFDFPNKNTHCMWMKDMRFALDIVWADEDGTIIKIEENVAESTFPQSFCAASAYVVEVNAGIIHQSGLQVGDSLTL